MRLFQNNASDLALPELKRLMPKYRVWCQEVFIFLFDLAGDVHQLHVVGIDIDGLIANDQLFVHPIRLSDDVKLAVTYVQLVLVFCQEFEVHRVVVFHLNDEEAESFFKFVGEYIKHLVVLIMDDLFDETDSKQLVQIELLFGLEIEVDTIFWGS